MSQRFPPIPLDGPSSLGSTFETEVRKHHGDNPGFKYKDQNGAPIGPFAVLSYTPDLFQPFMGIGDAILNQKDFEPRARELVVLAVMAAYDCPFVLYAHTRIAMKVGLSEEQVALACKGTVPTGLTDEESVIYGTALELARSRGPLDEHSWRRAEGALGREKSARLAHVVGLYLYSVTLLNLGAIPAPEDWEAMHERLLQSVVVGLGD